MFDAGFGADIKRLLIPLRRHERKQCVMVAATMSLAVRALITEQLPDMRDVTSSSLHKAAANCKHEFLRVPGAWAYVLVSLLVYAGILIGPRAE
jgi:superfamily II DNA/RNA helicase